MEFRQSVKTESRFSISKKNGPVIDDIETTYPFALQLYEKPPVGDLSLQEFGAFAVDRLKGINNYNFLNIHNDLEIYRQFVTSYPKHVLFIPKH